MLTAKPVKPDNPVTRSRGTPDGRFADRKRAVTAVRVGGAAAIVSNDIAIDSGTISHAAEPADGEMKGIAETVDVMQ